MMQSDPNKFEEPMLKEALRRAYPPEAAPPALRANVQAMLARAGQTDDASAQPIPLTRPVLHTRHRWHGRRLAAAAAIVGLGLGVGMFALTQRDQGPNGNQVAIADSPVVVRNALLSHDQLYDSMNAGADWRQGLTSVGEVRDSLRSQAPIAMPMLDLSAAGWQLAGAKACEVGAGRAAQLFYTRGNQTLSVFVLPPGQSAESIERTCAQTKSHITAVRNASGVTILLVGSCPDGSLTAREIDHLAAAIADQ